MFNSNPNRCKHNHCVFIANNTHSLDECYLVMRNAVEIPIISIKHLFSASRADRSLICTSIMINKLKFMSHSFVDTLNITYPPTSIGLSAVAITRAGAITLLCSLASPQCSSTVWWKIQHNLLHPRNGRA